MKQLILIILLFFCFNLTAQITVDGKTTKADKEKTTVVVKKKSKK